MRAGQDPPHGSPTLHALADSEARFRATFERAPVGMAHVGLDGRWLRFNLRLAEILGYPPDALAALTFQAVTYPPDLAEDERHVARLLAGEVEHYRMDKRYVRADGSLVWAALTVSLVRDAEHRPAYFIGVVQDISERKALEAERARLAAVVESSEDAILTKALDGERILSWNATAERLLGYPAAEAVGRPVALIIPPELHEEERGILERVGRGERVASYDTVRLRRDGRRIEVSLTVSPVLDETGRPVSAATILRDVTSRKRAEAALAEAKATAEAANRAKSQALAATSHDIRTPINAIIGYVDLLDLGIPGPLTSQQRLYLERVRLSGRHLLGVVNQVLDLAKLEAGQVELRPRPARAATAAAAAGTLVEPQAEARGVRVTNACPLDAADAYVGDPDRVEQMLVNLLTNAVKFTAPGGRVTLTCGGARNATPDAAVRPGAAPHGWTYFRVEDTGIGIASEHLAEAFEPYVQVGRRSNNPVGGTGLGLAITRQLARLMGGDVTARSAPGEGSTFFVWLPAPDPDALPPVPATERRGPSRYARGLGLIGDAALDEVERVLTGYAERLRRDPAVPSAHALNDAQLEDHTVTFLADMAQCLSAIEAARGAPSADLRDGTAIQRLIAERHGAQRARLGWSAAEVRREFEILHEELAAAVRRRVSGGPEVDVEAALALFGRFLDHALAASLRALGTGATAG